MARISDIARSTAAVGTRTKLLLTAISLIGASPWCPVQGFRPGDGLLLPHLTYSFQHVNAFHLLANLLVLWGIRRRVNAIAAYLIAVAASWLPMFTDRPTVGMSGMLFAMFGIMWGNVGSCKGFLKAGMPVLLPMLFFPDVINGWLHLYCYLIGFIVSRTMRTLRATK